MSESRSLRIATLTVAALLTVGSMVSGASGQVADTAAAGADQEVAAQDSAVADTTPPPVFPLFPAAASVSAGLAAEWNLPDLLATGALSFADLFEFGPHLDPLRAGFLEGPHFGVFAGAGAGSFGYDVEGYRVAPLLGGGARPQPALAGRIAASAADTGAGGVPGDRRAVSKRAA